MQRSIQHSTSNIQHSTFERVALPLLSAGIILTIWAVAVRYSGTKIFPSPIAVAKAIATLGEKSLLWHYIADSLGRVFAGYALAILAGIPLGFLLGWHGGLARAVNPLIQMLRPISPLAWMPLAVIWFGVSNAAPIFLIFLASFFPIVVAAMNGVRNVPPMYLQAGRNFGLSTSQLMLRVVAPAVLPRIIVGLRLAFGIAWVVLVAAEMIAVDSGLGYLIIDARNAGKRYDLVVAGMLLIGVIGLLLDTAIRRVEEWIVNEK
ncbi:MAG: NitT/TauT family transport system permease protein [Thermoanaerobaculia bacterium]|jgi:NitT/TauT family transport system permease protein|nr:NitT/TauT family transport system permease protein [Thermoanaerobaculia bacterium]